MTGKAEEQTKVSFTGKPEAWFRTAAKETRTDLYHSLLQLRKDYLVIM